MTPEPDVLSFQKDLVVWKQKGVIRAYSIAGQVSEGLSSVETWRVFPYCRYKDIVSEGLSSVETREEKRLLRYKRRVSEGLSSVETGLAVFGNYAYMARFRRT